MFSCFSFRRESMPELREDRVVTCGHCGMPYFQHLEKTGRETGEFYADICPHCEEANRHSRRVKFFNHSIRSSS